MASFRSIIQDYLQERVVWDVVVLFPNTDFGRVTAIEVVNGNLAEGPGSGISFWRGAVE